MHKQHWLHTFGHVIRQIVVMVLHVCAKGNESTEENNLGARLENLAKSTATYK